MVSPLVCLQSSHQILPLSDGGVDGGTDGLIQSHRRTVEEKKNGKLRFNMTEKSEKTFLRVVMIHRGELTQNQRNRWMIKKQRHDPS